MFIYLIYNKNLLRTMMPKAEGPLALEAILNPAVTVVVVDMAVPPSARFLFVLYFFLSTQ